MDEATTLVADPPEAPVIPQAPALPDFSALEEQRRIRSEFSAIVNMDVAEMEAHFASEDSDFASLDPRIALKLKQKSGKTLGKQALALKKKAIWEPADFEAAKSIIRPLKFQLGRKAQYLSAEGKPTAFAIALMNRGHNPLKGQQAVAAVAEAEVSMYQLETKIRDAVRDFFRSMLGGEFPDDIERPWTKDIFPVSQTVVVEWEGSLYKLGYTFSGTDVIVGPELVEVTIEYVPIAPEDFIAGEIVAVTEAEGAVGPQWKGVMIKAGAAKNKAPNGLPYEYTDAALSTAVAEGLFTGVPGFQRDDVQHYLEQGTTVVGNWGAAVWNAITRRVENTFTWVADKYPSLIHQKVKVAIQEGNKADLPGFSITGNVLVLKAQPHVVQKILSIRSCDPISFPSAGGEIIAVTESDTNKQETRGMKKVLELLKAKGLQVPSKLERQWQEVSVAEGAAADFMISQLKEKRGKMFETNTELEGLLQKNETLLVTLFGEFMAAEGVDVATPAEPAAGTESAAVSESDRELLSLMQQQALEGILRDSGLNEIEKGALRKQFTGQAFVVARVQEAVREAKDRQAAYGQQGRDTRIEVSVDGSDKIRQMFADIFFHDVDDVSVRESVNAGSAHPFISKHRKGSQRSFREAYIFATGDASISGQVTQVREGLHPTLILSYVQDAMNKRLALEWAGQMWNEWRNLATIAPLNDFKSRKISRTGYYEQLSKIAKNGPYPELAQGAPLSNSYSPDTYGGMISIHRHDIINDDVAEIGRIPKKVNVTAKYGLSDFAWSLILDNPTLGDSVALFHADHGNLLAGNAATYGLGTAGNLNKLVQKLREQTLPGLTGAKMQLPARFLIIPENETMRGYAYTALTPGAGANNQTPTFEQSFQLTGIVCPHATDADDYYVATDKSICEIIEIGFYNGQEEPEILVADTMTAGAMFTHDQMQFKARFDYGGGNVDYQGIAKAAIT